jgi:cell division protein FtsW
MAVSKRRTLSFTAKSRASTPPATRISPPPQTSPAARTPRGPAARRVAPAPQAVRPTPSRPLTRKGLLGSTPVRKVRSLRPPRPWRKTGQAVMATRVALQPDEAPAVAPIKPVQPNPAPELPALSGAVSAAHTDMLLLSTIVCLLMLGTVFIYSASMYQSYYSYENVNYYIIRQIAWLGLGSITLWVGLNFDYQKLRRFSMWGLFATAVLLLAIHVPKLRYGVDQNYRWIHLGPLTLQPSEIGKLALTIYAAHWLSSKDDQVKHSIAGLIPFGTVLGITTLLVFRQPDLGTAAVISIAMLCMFFISGARLRHLLILGAMALPVGYFVIHHGGYWQQRIDAWRDPWLDTQGIGYQISRSLLAFWHGGWTGTGLGNGTLKETIPAPMTDTIFATIGEETGLIGALLVALLFAYFAYRGMRISMLAYDPFGKLVAAGITTYLVCQALLNMLSVTNIIPFTGVPLPFISFGGSSLVVNMLAVGILLNISRHLEPVPEERRDLTGAYLWWRNRRPHLSMLDRGARDSRRHAGERR